MKKLLCVFLCLMMILPSAALAANSGVLKYDAPFYAGPGYKYACEFNLVSKETPISIYATVTTESQEQWAHVLFVNEEGDLFMAYTPAAYVEIYSSSTPPKTENLYGVKAKIVGGTAVSYGPDSEYSTRNCWLSDETIVYVIEYDGSSALIEYYESSSSSYIRGYVPGSCISYDTEKPVPAHKPGEIITLGRYEQDGDFSNGPEPIEWIILEYYEQGVAVLVSRYVLDYMPASYQEKDITWATSDIQNWLNGMFYETAFNEEEQIMIPLSLTWQDMNPVFDTDPGESINDHVRLLSISEAESLLTIKNRPCTATPYAISKGSSMKTVWWLRSPGRFQKSFACIDENGWTNYSGYNVSAPVGVRPAVSVILD